LFGTREQKAQWLPSLVAGEKLAAFALTERRGWFDAANVRMTATPSDDGSHYVLNGEKRYITNAAVSAGVDGNGANAGSGQAGQRRDYRVLVTPDTPGVEMIEGRNAEAWNSRHCHRPFSFKQTCACRKKNILGPLGKGLRVALTVLDFGRTTFGACCTGAAKTLPATGDRARQLASAIQKNTGDFDLVKRKSRAWQPMFTRWKR